MTSANPTARAPLRLAATGERATSLSVIIARVLALLVGGIGALEALLVDDGATGTLLSISLLAITPALWRGRSRARLVAAALLLGPLLLPSADKLGDFSAARIAAAAALLAASGAFPAVGDPGTRGSATVGLLAGACAAVADLADAHGLIIHPVLDAAVATSVIVLVRAVGPWRGTPASADGEQERAAELVRLHGVDTLAPFALRSDKTYFFSTERDAFLAYRVVAGVALVSGDPVGAPERLGGLVQRFCTYSSTRGWTVAAIGLSAQGLSLWRANGFDGHYIGEEAIVEPARFSLQGRSIRKVRQSVSRLAEHGYTTRILRSSELDERLASRLQTIAERWRGEASETGFSMAFAGVSVCAGRDDLFVVAFDADDEPRGFLHLGLAPAGHAVSLSSMRRDRETPNGLNEFLICALLAWAREHGIESVSLNFAAFAAVLDPLGASDRTTVIERRVLRRLAGRFQLERLHAFSRKFATGWTARYVAYPSRRSLPRVALAAMLAEGYVSIPRRLRKTVVVTAIAPIARPRQTGSDDR